MGRTTALVLALGLQLAFAVPHAQAQAGRAGLADRLAEAVASARVGGRVGISVVDAATGEVVYAHHADEPLNPASNMKLVTAAAALVELGADFVMRTGLYGEVSPEGEVAELVLRGRGDPSLRRSDLVELAAALAHERGVRVVRDVLVDGSYFDDAALPPAFEQQPTESAPFRAAVGAVSIEENAYPLRVVPGPAAGAPAVVRVRPEGYFIVDSRLTTRAGGAPRVVADDRVQGDRLRLVLSGEVPTGIRGLSYARRVPTPLPHAGHAMVEALRGVGIRVTGAMRLGPGVAGAPLLVSRASRPLAELLPALGKHSSNFAAEMLLKVLAAERRGAPGTSAHGAELLATFLERAGVPHGAATVVNGSGLYRGNLVAAGHLTALLAYVYRNPAVRAEYLAHLAIAGVDGTLASRLRDLTPARVVRAKTGTLADVVALSGYVLGRGPGEALAFSVLTNGVGGSHAAARALTDAIARVLVEALHAPAPAP